MTSLLRVCLALLLLAMSPAMASAQSLAFAPNPAVVGANVHAQFFVNTPFCSQTATATVTRNGSAIVVNYVLAVPPGTICFDPPPPAVPVDIALGTFAAGAYTVTAIGFDQTTQTAIPTQTGGFIVLTASGVPTLAPTGVAWLALLAALGGIIAWRRRARA